MTNSTRTAITASNFNAKLSTMVKSSKSLREGVNDLVVFGLEHYKDLANNGDTGYLTRLVLACSDLRTVPSKTVKDFIRVHANVKWGKNKAGQYTFTKQEKGAEPSVTMPITTWYNWEGNSSNVATEDFNLSARIKSLVSSLDTAVDAGKHIKTEDLELVVARLQKRIKALPVEELEEVAKEAATA